MKKYKICLYIAFICSVCMSIVLFEYLFYRQIPDVIYLKDGTEEKFEFALPVTGEITEDAADKIKSWIEEGTKREG